jgi:putative glutamine amidotransferase
VRAPLIAVSAGFPGYGDYMGLAYARPLEAVGALALQLPYLEDLDRVLDAVDGVLLGFGSDIDPAVYGGERHPAMTPHSPLRDAFELELARRALERGLPILGICRGMQVLNVVRGGTLLGDAAPHPGGDWDRWDRVRLSVIDGTDPPEHPGHTITVARDSRLAAALGTGSIWVNSYHHQAVDRLGDGIVPVAWAEDGVVEALELEGDAWVLAVQWELQESWKDDDRFLAVFAALAESARRRLNACDDDHHQADTSRAVPRSG